MAVRLVAVKELRKYAGNSRTHSDAQVDKLAAAIKTFGFTMPILADETGTIVAGHGRLLAAEILGLEEVPVATCRGWTDKEKSAYCIADNRLAELSEWDDAILGDEISQLVDTEFMMSVGYSELEIDLLLAAASDGNVVSFKGTKDQSNAGGATPVAARVGKENIRLASGEFEELVSTLRLYQAEHSTMEGFFKWLCTERLEELKAETAKISTKQVAKVT